MLSGQERRLRKVALGMAVRQRRMQLGISSQEALADLAGCDRQSINRLENAQYSTLVDNLESVAEALGWSMVELFVARDAVLREIR